MFYTSRKKRECQKVTLIQIKVDQYTSELQSLKSVQSNIWIEDTFTKQFQNKKRIILNKSMKNLITNEKYCKRNCRMEVKHEGNQNSSQQSRYLSRRYSQKTPEGYENWDLRVTSQEKQQKKNRENGETRNDPSDDMDQNTANENDKKKKTIFYEQLQSMQEKFRLKHNRYMEILTR